MSTLQYVTSQEAMRSRQIAERLGVEEAHMLEFQQFNKVWDKRMADFEHHAEDMVFAMRVSLRRRRLSFLVVRRVKKNTASTFT